MSFPFTEIENIIGYSFRDKALLKEAFTHSTYAHLHGGKDNERMEYLGDAVLQLVVTDWQYRRDERAEEGRLTFERQRFVCEDALDEAVRGLGLQKYLLIEGGRANIGKKTVSSLFETVIAAMAQMAPQRIVYVSCDPATLARDCKRLTEYGYTLTHAEAFDMFPRCAHVESVVCLCKDPV